ncbi:sugar transferase [Virgibacillus dakarensis]|uniref:Capsular polysaccharide biosynthesis protein n=1 Tax=Lentibacillus populi TaxID=1827502 RepID=A0A9W5X731_9BACI|nr:sugar transferase [Lentibacillus populi]MTW88096.1 sugar transferase [Virgibacillus dakarensis]GGB57812.1 capsular polysaccharide biosynthesis protein [Lentibacillus populi]
MELRPNARTYATSRINMYAFVKRLLDIAISLVLLTILAPLILVICIYIYKKDGQPVLLKRARAGKNNRVFIMLTFRTTTVPSRVIRAFPPHPFPDSWADGVPAAFTYKSNDKTRVTRFGARLRKYHIDKIPQLLNVLKGDMSLVGPQPEIPEITTYYNDIQEKRLKVRPGMTGYAQVNGFVIEAKHGLKIAYDLYYVRNCSFRFDMKILFRSLGGAKRVN